MIVGLIRVYYPCYLILESEVVFRCYLGLTVRHLLCLVTLRIRLMFHPPLVAKVELMFQFSNVSLAASRGEPGISTNHLVFSLPLLIRGAEDGSGVLEKFQDSSDE